MRNFLLVFLLGCICINRVYAQNAYNMTNGSAIGCEGILLDSGNGSPAGNYDHNEDYIFTICLPGEGQITFFFTSLCLEEPYDYMYIYDGSDTTATILAGPITDANPPQPISSSGNCITIYFHSDANVACSGWVAQWTSEIAEPVLPEMTLANINPTCSTSVITLNFDYPILCDSVIPTNFSIGGVLPNTVIAALPLNCLNDSTTSVQLQLNPGLNQSGYYSVTFGTTITDECMNVWELTTEDTLAVTDCPLFVTLEAADITICQGQCTDIDSDPEGGNFLNYQFTWNPPLPNGDGPFNVCPAQTTTYTVTVTDGSNAPPATDTLTIFVLPAPIITSGTVICQSSPPTNLSALPGGGEWEGPGIIDSLMGTFDPSETGPGVFDLTYYDPNGCPVYFQITVSPIDAGPDEAACPGTAPFSLTGFSPSGGTWSGTNVQPNGIFNPITVGTYLVTYTVNGCSDTKNINVQNILLTPIDTLCESEPAFSLTFTPFGGTWTGNGITDDYWGIFEADVSNEGLHTLTYTVHGCQASFDIFVKDLDVAWGFTACPSEAAFIVSPYPDPPGGVWSNGIGLMNPATGLYNPSLCSAGSCWPDILIYTVNGCSDTMEAYVTQTRINRDSLTFCPSDPPITLEWDNVQNTPWDGVWSGPGVTDPDFPGIFEPGVAGPGTHTLYYLANTCQDSITIIVRPIATPNDTSVCDASPPFLLNTVVPGGIWIGNGISDTLTGLFNPQITGIGTFPVGYITPDSCISFMNVTVFPLTIPSISGLPSSFCWNDTIVTLTANPQGGVFSGPGISGNTFSPIIAGVGQHFITYTYGSGVCQKSNFAVTNVSPPLIVTASTSKDTICFGDYATLNAQAAAGGSAAYTYSWDSGLGIGATKAVSPATTTTYTVIARDGCSEPVSASITVFVNPPFTLSFSVTETACFGESGSAVVSVKGGSNYTYSWHTTPPQLSDTLYAEAFYDYDVTVTDVNTGCTESGNVVIPGYPYVHAAFLTNPTSECIFITNPTFSLIDLSSGGIEGEWDFGDGTITPYQPGQQPVHTYQDTGRYIIYLQIRNEGGCSSSAIDTICVIPEISNLYIPEVFTPNQDGNNDEWYIVGNGFESYHIIIFDRWGKIVFESENPEERWNGKSKNQDCQEGVYTYSLKANLYSDSPRINYAARLHERKGTITLIR